MKKLTPEYTALQLDSLLEITTYEQMACRPHFVPKIDSDTTKPVEIIGFYPRLPEECLCGRSACRAHQRKGYHVKCSDGSETNIGWECGEKILGVVWEDVTGGFANKWAQKQTLEAVRRGVGRSGEYLLRIADVVDRPLGAKWLLKSMKSFDAETPREIVSNLRVRANRSEVAVREVRRRSAGELQLYDADHAPDTTDEATLKRYESRQDRLYVDEVVGIFRGLPVFNFDGRVAIFVNLKPKVEELSSINADSLPWTERRKWERWLRDLESEFVAIEKWLADGVEFFGSETNFSMLHLLTRDKDIGVEFKARAWDFENAKWKAGMRAA